MEEDVAGRFPVLAIVRSLEGSKERQIASIDSFVLEEGIMSYRSLKCAVFNRTLEYVFILLGIIHSVRILPSATVPIAG